MNDPFAAPRRLGKVLLGAIGVRIAFSLFLLVATPALARAIRSAHAFGTVMQGVAVVRTVLIVLIVLLTMLWLRSEVVALRATSAQTKTTPLMAILGWFIPFANVVLPCLAAREVFRLRLPRSSGALPILWWISYVAMIVANNVRLPFPIGLGVMLGCFGLWFAMVYAVVAAPAVPRLGVPPAPQPWHPTSAPAWPPR